MGLRDRLRDNIANLFKSKETREKETSAAREVMAEQKLQEILGSTYSFGKCCDCLTGEDQERFEKFCNMWKADKTKARAFLGGLILNSARNQYNSGKMDELPPVEKWSTEMKSNVLKAEEKSSNLLRLANLGSQEEQNKRYQKEHELARMKRNLLDLRNRTFSANIPDKRSYDQLAMKTKEAQRAFQMFNDGEKIDSFAMLKLLMIAISTDRIKNVDKAVEISKKAQVDKNNRRTKLGLRESGRMPTAQKAGGRAG